MTVLLSDPILDELYNIRRVLIGRHNAVLKIKDEVGIRHYESKVNAMDAAIVAYIDVNKIAPELVEQTMAVRAKEALGIRVPGSTE